METPKPKRGAGLNPLLKATVPAQLRQEGKSGPPAPPTGRSPSHTRSRLCLEPLPPVLCRPSLRAPQGPRLRGLPEVAPSRCLCAGPILLLLETLPTLCLACLGGTPGPPPHPPPPPLLAAPTPPAGAGQPSLTRAPHRVPRGPLAHSTLEVAGKRLCSLSASIHSRVPTMARGAERAGCRQIGSLAECIWGGGSQVELPAASRAPPRPSRTPACSPVPHLLTAAPPAFSLCCRGACTIAPPTPGPWTGLSSPLWRAGFPPLALGMLCSRHQGTS